MDYMTVRNGLFLQSAESLISMSFFGIKVVYKEMFIKFVYIK